MKVKAQRNEDTGMIELGVEEDGHFVAIATLPATQYDSTLSNLKASASNEEPAAA